MARDERKRLAQLAAKNLETVSYLISPQGPSFFTKQVKIGNHNLGIIFETAWSLRRIHMTTKQIVAALKDYYLTKIKPSNPYIVSFDFKESPDGMFLEVFATILVSLKPPEQSDSLILGTKVPLPCDDGESPGPFTHWRK